MCNALEEALDTLGDLLASRSLHYELVAIGGGSLLLLKLMERPTKDLDILARMEGGGLIEAEPFPEPLVQAVADTGAALQLGQHWLNTGPASQLQAGLPQGFISRLQTRRFGKGLTLYIASRFDQICLKLFASVDQGPLSKHFTDLKRLRPTHEECKQAGRWVETQDGSEIFAKELRQALASLESVLNA